MNDSDKQVDDGKAYVQQVLSELSVTLGHPWIAEAALTMNDKDFDYMRFSLLDSRNQEVITKISRSDLVDSDCRKKLGQQIEAAVRGYVASPRSK